MEWKKRPNDSGTIFEGEIPVSPDDVAWAIDSIVPYLGQDAPEIGDHFARKLQMVRNRADGVISVLGNLYRMRDGGEHLASLDPVVLIDFVAYPRPQSACYLRVNYAHHQRALANSILFHVFDRLGLFQNMPVPNPPWEQIPDRGYDRQLIKLWHSGLQAGEIAHQLGIDKTTINKRIGILRKRYGKVIVPSRR